MTDDLVRVVEQLRPSVVKLRGAATSATGFLVTGDGYLITAAHFGMSSGSIKVEPLGLTAERIDQDSSHDLSLLKVDAGSRELRPVEISAVPPAEGESIAVSGYPMKNHGMVTTAGIVASLSGQSAQQGQNDDRYVADVSITWGNSDGPVYLANTGEVIGVCSEFQAAPLVGEPEHQQNTGLGIVVPIRYARELLSRHRSVG